MSEKIKIFIGSDYRGFKRKTELLPFLASRHDFLEIIDKGVENEDQSDYNDVAISVAKSVKENQGSFGILICDSSHGVSIQANRFKGIRAISASSKESAKLGREHEDANVLCLSAGLLDLKTTKEIIHEFFHTKFEKIERRVKRIERLDKEVYD